MKKIAALLMVLALAAAANATNPVSLGYSDQTYVEGPQGDACANGALYLNADGTFENGYAWQYGGIAPPYYGCFGEAYGLGAGTVYCGSLFISTLSGYYTGQPADVYVWDGGIAGLPGNVVGVVTGVNVGPIAIWPAFTQRDVDLNIVVTGDFTVGYWADFSQSVCGWFCGADLDGFGGAPWTNLAPGSGYGTGWADPSVVWGPTMSMGLGAWFDTHIPVENQTWGSIKSLFE